MSPAGRAAPTPRETTWGDARVLFMTRTTRLFAYGFLSVILVLYLVERGLSEAEVGLLLTLTLLGDTVVSLAITTRADRWGRKRTLALGAVLMAVSGLVFASTSTFWLLLLAATMGVISPSGKEVGPFLAIEQAALAHVVPAAQRTRVFAWYALVGSFATALGALVGGVISELLQHHGFSPVQSYQFIVAGYAASGLGMLVLFARLTSAVEVADGEVKPGVRLGLHRSQRVVLKLAALFSLDSFAGGFVVQSLLAYWFHLRFGVEPASLGAIFFGANLLAGFSALAAVRVADRIGLVRTMVFTHLPSNVLLILVPLMPSLDLAVLVLLVRFSISQMDVPTRQSYVMAMVHPDERSAAAGVTGVARTTGAAFSPLLSAMLLASAQTASVPFFLAGGLKILYDLVLYRGFVRLRTPEEE
jgi:MFS family permease